MSVLSWFRRSPMTSTVRTPQFLDACADRSSDFSMFRFIIDTRKRLVIAVPPRGSHLETVIEYLRMRERELTMENSGHLIGGTVVVKGGFFSAQIGRTSFSGARGIAYPSTIVEEAEKMMTDFFERSPMRVKYKVYATQKEFKAA